MKEHQRQLFLLIAVMAFLVAAFVIIISTSPNAFQIQEEPERLENTSINQSQLNLPGPLNNSVTGLQKLYKDFSAGMSLGFESGESS